MTETVKLLGLSGSLRAASANTAVLRTMQESLREPVSMRLFPLDPIPPYNQDLDGPDAPAAVRDLKAAIQEADGVVIASPEYNFGMSGVLKNALDWASRPAFASPFKDKPVLIVTSSPAFTGGVRAQAQVRETLSGMLARVIARPPVVIAGVFAKIQADRLADADNLAFAMQAVEDLLAEIVLLKQRSQTQRGA